MHYSAIIFYGLLIVAIIATLRNPFWGVAAYYYFSFFRPQDYYHWALTGSRLSYWIALVAIYSYFLHKGRKGYTIPKNKETLFMLLFWIFMALSCFFSPIMEHSWPFFLLISKLIIFYFFAVAIIDDEKKFKIMLWIFIYSFAYYAIWVNNRYIFEGIKIIEGPGLGGAAYRDRNTFALIFVIAIPVCFYMIYIVQNKWVKLALLGIVPVLMHAIICTFSRGAYLGMLAVCGYSMLRMKRKAVIVLAILIFIPMLARMQGKEHRERIRTVLVTGEERERSAQSRIEAWKGGLRMMADHPLVGVGLQNFEAFIKRYNPEVVNLVAHNTYIQIGGEAGIPAVVAYILVMICSFITLFKLRFMYARDKLSPNLYYYSLMLEGSLLGFFVCSLFLSMEIFEPAFFLFCMVVCLKKLAEKGAFNLERKDNGRDNLSPA